MVVNSQFHGELPESWIIELLTIICHDNSWNVEPAYNCLPNEVLDVLFCYCGQWFSFYPFSEIVDRDYQEF